MQLLIKCMTCIFTLCVGMYINYWFRINTAGFYSYMRCNMTNTEKNVETKNYTN